MVLRILRLCMLALDLNAYMPDAAGGASAYSFGHRVGYAMQGECDVCQVSMSEAFPSAGK